MLRCLIVLLAGSVAVACSDTGTGPGSPAIPHAPSALQAVTGAPDEVRLVWEDNSTNELAFEVDRCVGAGCRSFQHVARVQSDSYVDRFVVAGEVYTYRVAAINGSGASPSSNAASFAVPGLPGAPSNLNVAAMSHHEARLTWHDNSTDETGFVVERCIGEACTNFSILGAAASNLTILVNDSLPAGVYHYRVIAVTPRGRAASNSARVEIIHTVTAAPVLDRLERMLGDGVRLWLTPPDGAVTGYFIERCTGAGCTDFARIRDVAQAADTAIDFTVELRTYRYRVQAYNAAGASPYSNVLDVTITSAPLLPGVPGELHGSVRTDRKVEVTWSDNSTNEARFVIERCHWDPYQCVSDGDFQVAGYAPENATTYLDGGTANIGNGAGSFTYRVRAGNSSGVSAPSNKVSVYIPAQPGTF